MIVLLVLPAATAVAPANVVMTMTPYPWEIHVLIASDGFERTTQTFTMSDQGGNLVTEFKKQA